jgi:acyl-CoA thioester hydrolase
LDTEVHLKGQTTWRVYYEDTDFSGYVYHANYLKFFERGREELLGVEKLQELFKKGLHFVVAKIQISYHKPARHADLISVHTSMTISLSPVVLCEQSAWLGDEKLVTANLKLAAIDTQGTPRRMSREFLESFKT